MSTAITNVRVASVRPLVSSMTGQFSAVLNVGFILLDVDGELDDATPTACALFAAASVDELRTRWPSLGAEVAAALKDATIEVPTEVDIRFEVDQEPRSVRCEIRVLEGDNCAGHLLLVQPLDRAARLEGVLRLASRYQTLSSLYLTTVHDFKGSLNAMGLDIDLLEQTLADQAVDSSAYARCLRTLRTELKRLERSMGAVLDQSRLDFAPESRVDLNHLIDAVVALLGARAERQGVTIRHDAVKGAVDVMGYPDWLQQAILNLATNALDAMPDGGELLLGLTAKDGWATVTVADTGPGVPREIQRKIWTLYFSTKAAGHGIGLHVVKRIAAAHGGSISLAPTDRGARFALSLPLAH